MKPKYTREQFKACYEHTSKDNVLYSFYYEHIELIQLQKERLELKKYLLENKNKKISANELLKKIMEMEIEDEEK